MKTSHWCLTVGNVNHTVDGRHPAPVDMVNILSFTGFDTSQVVQDFFHQQYAPFFQNVLLFHWKGYSHVKCCLENHPLLSFALQNIL